MKIVLILFAAVFSAVQLQAQCISGNCINGKGAYNYGWCTYKGNFSNGKPEGAGEMKYDDYTYTGNFKNGLEDGDGVIVNSNGTKENVHYVGGKKTTSAFVKLAPGEYKPLDVQDANCVSGNCNTGYGTYQFPSGNKYTGNFSAHKREGAGTAFFANGDKFIGTWHNNEKTNGTYHYSTGASYTGSYDQNGMEYNGNIVSVAGMSIPFVNGKAIIPPQPVIPVETDRETQQGQGATQTRMKRTCPMCNGLGKTHETYYDYRYDEHGNGVFGGYSNCIRCNGTGVVD